MSSHRLRKLNLLVPGTLTSNSHRLSPTIRINLYRIRLLCATADWLRAKTRSVSKTLLEGGAVKRRYLRHLSPVNATTTASILRWALFAAKETMKNDVSHCIAVVVYRALPTWKFVACSAVTLHQFDISGVRRGRQSTTFNAVACRTSLVSSWLVFHCSLCVPPTWRFFVTTKSR